MQRESRNLRTLHLIGGGGPPAKGGKTMATMRMVDRYITERVRTHTLMESSAKEIRGTLRRFAASVPEVHQITRRRVQRWLDQLDVAAGTARSYFHAVRGFCQWLVLERHLDRDPTLGMRPPKKPDYHPRALEPSREGGHGRGRIGKDVP